MFEATNKAVINGRRYALRSATQEDVAEIVNLDNLVWGNMGATREMIASRIRTFSRGQIVGVSEDGRIVGYVSIQYVQNLEQTAATWNTITDNGTISHSHSDDGQYIFGVNLKVHPDHGGLGFPLQARVWHLCVREWKIGGYIGSRVPSYHRVQKRYPIENWVLGEKGKSHDAEVRYHQKAGFRILRIVPEYFQDPESLDYGVLMYAPNHFRNLPFSPFWRFLILKVGFTIVRVFMREA